MSRITNISTHKTDAKSRMLQQYKGKVNFEGMVDAYLGTQAQSIEDSLEDLYNRLNIDLSEGTQLDYIGEIVGANRAGNDDVTYRILLKAQIANNVSEGTFSQILNLWVILTNANIIYMKETYPAEVNFSTSSGPTAGLETLAFNIMQDALPAGVQLGGVTIFDEDEAFAFEGYSTDTTYGFGDLLDANVGGKFAALMVV